MSERVGGDSKFMTGFLLGFLAGVLISLGVGASFLMVARQGIAREAMEARAEAERARADAEAAVRAEAAARAEAGKQLEKVQAKPELVGPPMQEEAEIDYRDGSAQVGVRILAMAVEA